MTDMNDYEMFLSDRTEGDFAELERALEAADALLRKLLVEDPKDMGYVGKPEAWPTGGYSIILDHGVSLTEEEAEFVRRIQAKSPLGQGL